MFLIVRMWFNDIYRIIILLDKKKNYELLIKLNFVKIKKWIGGL